VTYVKEKIIYRWEFIRIV